MLPRPVPPAVPSTKRRRLGRAAAVAAAAAALPPPRQAYPLLARRLVSMAVRTGRHKKLNETEEAQDRQVQGACGRRADDMAAVSAAA